VLNICYSFKMHYIRALFVGGGGDWVHDWFTRYGRGEYPGPVCEVDVKKDIRFKGSVEYCNAFGWVAAQLGGDFKVNGALYGKRDFRGELRGLGLDFEDKSKPKRGLYAVELSEDALPGGVLAQVYEKAPYATVLLGIAGGCAKLTCKKKPPKPGKDKDLDFCSGALDVSVLGKLRDEVLWDAGDFTKARVENRFIIDELVIPEGVGAAEARLQARRRGRVRRRVTVDGEVEESECQLLV